jgi:ABC-type polysaccharide/polyol phosphate transport system ATPase subunit
MGHVDVNGVSFSLPDGRPLLGDVTFRVGDGATVALVGPNGAGKSTLMRALAGILPPTSGEIEVNGRVSTLLALGVGFNANLTGRENVLLGGLAAGLSRAEVRERYDEIAAFADLEDGFMEMPMRTYSSGMFGRLAFAVAVHMEPDILLVDEALSVGDEKFQRKCRERMEGLVARGKTFMLVSHSLDQIRDNCDRVLWLHHGRIVLDGPADAVAEAYHQWSLGESDAVTAT